MTLLKDKVAIVTGAGRGIGRATALALAREGAHVLVNDLGCSPQGEPLGEPCADEVVAAIREEGGSAEADRSDVADPLAAAALVERAQATWGALDILINNAGIASDAPLHRLSAAEWQRSVDIQLSGSFHCLGAAARLMKKAGSGSIINTTSLAGLRGNWGQAHGSAAAAGVIGLTRSASIELQKYGVRVNAVAPVAKTRLTEGLPLFAHVDSMRPEHITPAHVFLASELSKEVTGVVVCAAGGRISVFRLVESLGALKEDDDGLWSAAEIAEHWSTIARS